MRSFDLWRDQDLKIDIANNMINHGGEFVQLLGRMLFVADSENLMNIESAWPQYLEDYLPEKWGK